MQLCNDVHVQNEKCASCTLAAKPLPAPVPELEPILVHVHMCARGYTPFYTVATREREVSLIIHKVCGYNFLYSAFSFAKFPMWDYSQKQGFKLLKT